MLRYRSGAMDGYERYAIYWAPDAGRVCRLRLPPGWDGTRQRPARGLTRHGPACRDRPPTLTATPRKYGFHGTVKPPFRLATGADGPTICMRPRSQLCRALARCHAAGSCPAQDRRLRGTDAAGRRARRLPILPPRIVDGLDRFRAPPDAAEIARSAARAAERPAAGVPGPLGLSLCDGGIPLPPDADRRPARGRGGAMSRRFWRPASPRCCRALRCGQPLPVRSGGRRDVPRSCIATRFPAEALRERPPRRRKARRCSRPREHRFRREFHSLHGSGDARSGPCSRVRAVPDARPAPAPMR